MVEYKNIIYMDFATFKMSKVSRFVGCFITGGSGKFIDLKIKYINIWSGVRTIPSPWRWRPARMKPISTLWKLLKIGSDSIVKIYPRNIHIRNYYLLKTKKVKIWPNSLNLSGWCWNPEFKIRDTRMQCSELKHFSMQIAQSMHSVLRTYTLETNQYKNIISVYLTNDFHRYGGWW